MSVDAGNQETYSNFLPIVTVYSDGRIEVDWSDSQQSTYVNDDEANDLNDEHAQMLDTVLGFHRPDSRVLTPSDRLRLLADYIEAKMGTERTG